MTANDSTYGISLNDIKKIIFFSISLIFCKSSVNIDYN